MNEKDFTTDVDEYIKFRENQKYNRELQVKYSMRLLEILQDVKGNPELVLCGKIAAMSVVEPKTDVCCVIRQEALDALKRSRTR